MRAIGANATAPRDARAPAHTEVWAVPSLEVHAVCVGVGVDVPRVVSRSVLVHQWGREDARPCEAAAADLGCRRLGTHEPDGWCNRDGSRVQRRTGGIGHLGIHSFCDSLFLFEFSRHNELMRFSERLHTETICDTICQDGLEQFESCGVLTPSDTGGGHRGERRSLPPMFN